MTINAKVVAEIAQKTPTAEDFFEYCAKRERSARGGISRLPAIRAQMKEAGYEPVPQDLLLMFRELERANFGTLQGDKFKWRVSIKELGETLTAAPERTPEPQGIPNSVRTLSVYLGRDKEVNIQFTGNLTPDEAHFVYGKFLQSCQE